MFNLLFCMVMSAFIGVMGGCQRQDELSISYTAPKVSSEDVFPREVTVAFRGLVISLKKTGGQGGGEMIQVDKNPAWMVTVYIDTLLQEPTPFRPGATEKFLIRDPQEVFAQSEDITGKTYNFKLKAKLLKAGQWRFQDLKATLAVKNALLEEEVLP